MHGESFFQGGIGQEIFFLILSWDWDGTGEYCWEWDEIGNPPTENFVIKK